MRYAKIITVLILLLGLACSPAMAQRRRPSKEDLEKFESMRIAFFTENLDLSPSQAELFWPIYNAYHDRKDKLMRERWIRQKKMDSHLDTLSEASAKRILEKHIQVQKEITRMDTRLQEDLLEFLPPTKVVTLYITEIRFREHMLRTLREERKRNHGSRRR